MSCGQKKNMLLYNFRKQKIELTLHLLIDWMAPADQPHENFIFPEEVLPRGNAL